jgi:membrane-associated phospholipid phosphatase
VAPPPLLARRSQVGLTIGVAAAGVTVLGYHYAGDVRAGRIDTAVDSRLRAHLRDHLLTLHRLVTLGDPTSVVLVCAALVGLFLLMRRPRLALLAAVGPAVAAALAEFVLKPLIGRRMDDALSFPSGHTTGVVAIAVVVAVAMLGPQHPRWPVVARWAVCVAALAGAALVATALVGAGYHYATDTLGGLCVAVGAVLSVGMLIDLLAERRAPHARLG